MRFNPKADISSGRVSDAGGSGGGGLGGLGGGRLPIPTGGGVGGIVVVLIIMAVTYFSGGLGALTGDGDNAAPDTDRYAECKTGADANDSEDCKRVGVEVSMSNYWEKTLPAQSDAAFRDTSITTFTGSVSTACGGAQSAVGPFYCPADQKIYLDTTFFPEVLQKQLGGKGGDFVEPYVLAHEYGHHIQNLLGTMNRVRTQQGEKSDAVRLELQADCYAGMWARSASSTADDQGTVLLEDLTEKDITEALDSAKAVGDDRIQQRSGGQVNPEQWTHGSAAQRQEWFRVGYEQGTLKACDTFARGAL